MNHSRRYRFTSADRTSAMKEKATMHSTFKPVYSQRANRFSVVVCLLAGLPFGLPVYGQMSPEEHASHHPGQAAGASPAEATTATPQTTSDDVTVPAQAATSDSTGGMGGGMGGMMEKMGAPPPRELYPTLMNMPEVTSEERTEILSQAEQRMASAVALLSEGLESLARAAESDDYGAMQDASAKMHEALSWLDSGVAAQRALAEGQPPHQVAMQWFKSEMNLQPPQGVEVRSGLLGATPFHLFSMVLLVVFALVMVALYFLKMRRAAALFGRIEASKGAPPPGSAPALAGTAPASGAKGASA